LSFNYAIKNTGLIINGCQLDNNFSEYHEWPVKTNRKTPKTKTNNLVEAINDVPIARLAQLEYENGLLRRTGVTKESTFQRILARLYKNRPAVVVQVGACDGKINDPIYDIIKSRIKTSTVVLIEPQPELIDILKSNYEFHPDVRCENIAIGPRGQLILYRLKKTLWSEFQRTYLKEAPLYRVPCGFVSQSYDHVLKHIVGRLPNNILVEQAIEKLEVESKELIDVLNAQNIKSVDILQIDAEGLDDQVIYHCNIDRCKPSIIHFEHIHLGIDKKLKLHKYLRQSGYVVCEYSKSDTLAISTQLNDIPTDLFPVGSIL
jgi:FkbM family methyltransferase